MDWFSLLEEVTPGLAAPAIPCDSEGWGEVNSEWLEGNHALKLMSQTGPHTLYYGCVLVSRVCAVITSARPIQIRFSRSKIKGQYL